MNLSWKSCLRAAAAAFGLYLCIHYWPAAANLLKLFFGAATPLLVGCAIAYPTNILMEFYGKLLFSHVKKERVQKLRNPLSLLLAFFIILAIIALVLLLIIPQLASCVRLIIDGIPAFMEHLLDRVSHWSMLPEEAVALLNTIDWASQMEHVMELLKNGVGSLASVVLNAVSSVFSGLVTTGLSLIFSVYLVLGKHRLASQWNRLTTRYLPKSWCERISYVLHVVNDSFHRFLVGQCTEAVILGCLCMAGMLLLRLPYASMIGALIAFTALIPVAGAFIGAAVGAFLILMVDPMQALVFLIFIVILQQLENNLIYPKVVGTSLGLPGMWVLAAITVGGGVLGVFGMLLGVPILATVYRLVREDVQRGEGPVMAGEPTESQLENNKK